MRNAFYLIICLFSMMMCINHPKELLPELSQAESLMQQFPDSALLILNSMKTPSPSDELQYATWCLLVTQARDKNYVKHTSDSMINIALNYFEKQDDPVRKATALYYEGRVNQDMNNAEEATNYYLRARDVAKETRDYRLLYLINSQLGTLYAYRDLADLALMAYKDAHDYSILLKDSLLISNSYSCLGRISTFKNNLSEGLNYYKRAIDIAKQSRNSDALSLAYGEISTVYQALSMLDSCVYYLEKVKNIEEKSNISFLPQTYLGIGDTYRLMAQFDSSSYYLKKALNTSNIYIKQAVTHGLYYLYRDFGKYKEAIDYNDQYWLYTDSVENINQSSKIAEIQAKYDKEKLLNINNQLEIEKGKIKLWGVVIFLVVIGALTYLYQRKLLRKERAIQATKEELESYLVQLHKNKDVIRQNKNLIETLSVQLETASEELQSHLAQLHENEDVLREKESQIESLSSQVKVTSDLQKHIKDLTMEIDQIQNSNDLLQTQNESLQQNIEHYTSSLQQKGKELETYKRLDTENAILHNREKYLCTQLIKRIEILYHFTTAPKCIQEYQWPEIFESIEVIHPNFIRRLQNDFPLLTDGDLQVCCLIKLHLSNSILSTLMGISLSSVTKRKQRLKDRINQELKTPLTKDMSLETFLWEY